MVARTVLERDVSHLTVSEVCARPFPGLRVAGPEGVKINRLLDSVGEGKGGMF